MTNKEAIGKLDELLLCTSLLSDADHESIRRGIKALEERSQGKWRKIGEEYYNWHNHTVIKCSHCGYVKNIPGGIAPNFCEDCGADMRGKENGEDSN